jgi:hypothetical protein
LTKSISSYARKKASKLAVLFILIGTTFVFYPQANAATAYADVTCATQDGTQQTYQIGWDNSNQFFADKGYIPRLFCEGGYAPPGFNVYVSDNLSDSATGYYNGVVPTPVVSPNPETQTVQSETVTAEETVTAPTSDSTTVVDSPTVSSDTQTATQETSSVTSDTQTSTSDSATPVLPAETSTVDTQTVESIPTPEVTPLPEPEPVIQPEPVVVPPPTPKPEPLPEPIPDPIPEPEPEPTVDNIDEPGLQIPDTPEEPVVVEPTPEEETPAEEPVTEPEVTEPEVVEEPEPLEPEVIPSEPEPSQPEPPIVEPTQPEVVVLNDTTDLSSLAPDTPVELENGVVLTAEVVIALQLLENPAELLAEIFTDPGQVLMALGNIGADMSPEVREQSEKVVIAAVIAGNIATQAAASAALAAYRRNI